MTHMAVPKIIRNFELQTEDSNVLVYTTRRSPGFISTDAGTCVHGLQYSLALLYLWSLPWIVRLYTVSSYQVTVFIHKQVSLFLRLLPCALSLLS